MLGRDAEPLGAVEVGALPEALLRTRTFILFTPLAGFILWRVAMVAGALLLWGRWKAGVAATGAAAALILSEAQRSPARRPDEEERPGPRLVDGDGRREQRPGVVGFAKQLKEEYSKDDVPIWASAMAYRLFLALFPFFIFLAAMAGFIAGAIGIQNPTQQMIDALIQTLPANAAQLIGEQLGQVVSTQNPGLLSIGIIGAIWAASSAVQMLMQAMNNAYDVPETRPLWKRYPLAIGLTLLVGLVVIVATVLFFTGQFFAMDIVSAMGFEAQWVGTLISWLRWPVVLVLMMAAVAFLYWVCPNAGLPLKWVTPGAVLFVVVWLIATALFSLYVANFGNYNATYGALGGVVIVLIWMYASSVLLLLGAEINAIADERAEPEKMAEQRREKYAAAA